jgi:hypothetical protein
MSTSKPPKELDAIADVVLAYHPKPKSKSGKKRKKRQKRLISAKAAGDGKSHPRSAD